MPKDRNETGIVMADPPDSGFIDPVALNHKKPRSVIMIQLFPLWKPCEKPANPVVGSKDENLVIPPMGSEMMQKRCAARFRDMGKNDAHRGSAARRSSVNPSRSFTLFSPLPQSIVFCLTT